MKILLNLANLGALIQWLTIGEQVFDKGATVWADIQKVLAAHGIAADTAALDAVIADAARRKALAEQDAAVAQVSGTGSTGE